MVVITYLNSIAVSNEEFEGIWLSYLQISQVNRNVIDRDLEHVLSAKERIYYDRLFRNKKRQREMYCGRLAAKKLVSKKFNYKKSLKNIELIKSDMKEKPKLFIDNKKMNVDLSIAHNDEYAVVGGSCKGRIGIDIEKSSLQLEESFVKYNFCEEEISCWEKFKYDDSNIWILLWTMKEAIGKALGIGLSLGMDFVKILINENRNGLELIFNEKKISGILNDGENIELYFLKKEDNYISICYLIGR